MAQLDDAIAFMTTHARLLDRHRAYLALGEGDVDAALAVLAGYRNRDGGFGWGLEPDLRAPASQPVGALHAFEVLEEIAPATSPLAAQLCDWLASAALDNGALPFALRGADSPGTAPLWATADPTAPSLHITAAVAGIAHRVAKHDRAVAEHPWLTHATDYCMQEIAGIRERPFALLFRYVLQLLDALHDNHPGAADELDRLATLLPASGTVAVTGGSADEAMRPLDFSPFPDRPLRAHLDPHAIEEDLDRLEAEQDQDGGWHVDWVHWSPAAGLEWRGWATVRALRILLVHGRLHAQAAP